MFCQSPSTLGRAQESSAEDCSAPDEGTGKKDHRHTTLLPTYALPQRPCGPRSIAPNQLAGGKYGRFIDFKNHLESRTLIECICTWYLNRPASQLVLTRSLNRLPCNRLLEITYRAQGLTLVIARLALSSSLCKLLHKPGHGRWMHTWRAPSPW